jgi:hypothetical protein
MKNILTALLCFIMISAFAQTEIKVDDAKNHIGETVKICTKIFGGKFFEKDSLTLLNAGGFYPDAPLTIVIRGKLRDEFNKPEEYYKSAEVCITGKLEMFRERPEIVIFKKDQIEEQLKDHTDQEPK